VALEQQDGAIRDYAIGGDLASLTAYA